MDSISSNPSHGSGPDSEDTDESPSPMLTQNLRLPSRTTRWRLKKQLAAIDVSKFETPLEMQNEEFLMHDIAQMDFENAPEVTNSPHLLKRKRASAEVLEASAELHSTPSTSQLEYSVPAQPTLPKLAGYRQATSTSDSQQEDSLTCADAMRRTDEAPDMLEVGDTEFEDPWFDLDRDQHPSSPKEEDFCLEDVILENVEFEVPEFEELWFDCKEPEGPQDNSTDDPDMPLYEGATVSLAESMLMVLLFTAKHHITGVALVDLLTLISLHCIKPNVCRTSLHMFRKYFGNLKNPLKFHKYCTFCNYLLTQDRPKETCPVCSHDVSSDNGISYFIEIPIIGQLRTLLKRRGFYNDLQHRFTREKKNKEHLEDIYDGEQYKRHFQPGEFLYEKSNISLMWYTDGCPIFKSSKLSLWPMFFAINELPYHKRFLKENLIYAGLWLGSKPSVGTFLKPFQSSLQQLHDGVDVVLPGEQHVTVKGVVLCGTCDLPAKCIMLNMVQFNGKYGCAHCLQRGSSASTGKGSVWTYPFCMENPKGPPRSQEGFLNDGKLAYSTQSKTPVNGVKGPTFLSCFGMDLAKGMSIDYMHTVLLGVSKKLMHLWFDSGNNKELFSLSKVLDKIDNRLTKLKPPHFISRTPRSIKEHLAYWKASEYRSWLFYYSLPVLKDSMNKLFFEHYALLVESIVILNGNSISISDVNYCESLLNQFCCLFGTLYGDRYSTAVVHLLLHIPDVVRSLGPLWVYSCFAFEDTNGKLLKMVKGTQKPHLQIASNLCAMLKVPELLQNIPEECEVLKYISHLSGKRGLYASGSSKVPTIIGTTTRIDIEPFFLKLLIDTIGYTPRECYRFLRVQVNGVVIHCSEYRPVSKRNSFTVMYTKDQVCLFGQIEFFIMCTNECACSTSQCHCIPDEVALIRQLPCSNENVVNSSLTLRHLRAVSNSSKAFHTVPVKNILELCVFIEMVDPIKAYIARAPNTVESD